MTIIIKILNFYTRIIAFIKDNGIFFYRGVLENNEYKNISDKSQFRNIKNINYIVYVIELDKRKIINTINDYLIRDLTNIVIDYLFAS